VILNTIAQEDLKWAEVARQRPELYSRLAKHNRKGASRDPQKVYEMTLKVIET
jgi:hypothetical protein